MGFLEAAPKGSLLGTLTSMDSNDNMRPARSRCGLALIAVARGLAALILAAIVLVGFWRSLPALFFISADTLDSAESPLFGEPGIYLIAASWAVVWIGLPIWVGVNEYPRRRRKPPAEAELRPE